MITLFKGILVGMAVAIPVGPVGLFCLEKTACYGWKTGLPTTLSMNLADVLSAFVVLCGLTLVQDVTTQYASLIRIMAGLVIMAIGIHIIVTRKTPPKPLSAAQMAASSATTFLLSISPATFALMLLLFTSFKVTAQYGLAWTLVGVLIGSGLWSLTILVGGHFLSRCIQNHLVGFKLGCGCIFVGAGLFSALSQFF